MAVTVSQRFKIQENEKLEKYQDLTREIMKWQHMRIRVIIIIDPFVIMPKTLYLRLNKLEIQRKFGIITITKILASVRMQKDISDLNRLVIISISSNNYKTFSINEFTQPFHSK